jgi:hypothetical protein
MFTSRLWLSVCTQIYMRISWVSEIFSIFWLWMCFFTYFKHETFMFWRPKMSGSLYRIMIWHHFITSVFHKFLAGMLCPILINSVIFIDNSQYEWFVKMSLMKSVITVPSSGKYLTALTWLKIEITAQALMLNLRDKFLHHLSPFTFWSSPSVTRTWWFIRFLLAMVTITGMHQ